MIGSLLAWTLALTVSAPLAIYIVELAAGLPPSRKTKTQTPVDVPTVVLIPAHDEAVGLAATLLDLHQTAPSHVRVLVVADNCADATAAIARAHGAEVAERTDETARGKGYALAFGRDHLAYTKAPELVVILDADCRFEPGSIEALTAACRANPGRPMQAINLIAPDRAAPPLTQIAGFAMVVKNLFRSRGMGRLGGAALLTGTGMAFPWPLFAGTALASGSLVEDLDLGIALTRAGHLPLLVESAQVSSAPAPAAVALIQRTRWEHGFLGTARRAALPLLAHGLSRGSRAETLLGAHLLVPPLALLLLAASGALVAAGTLAALGAVTLPAVLIAAMLAVTLALTFVAWLSGGRRWLTGHALLRAPLYVLWKLPIYLTFLRKRETVWQRTPRAGE